MSLNLNELLENLEQSSEMEKKASQEGSTKPSVSAELSHVLEKKASQDLTKQAFNQGEELARQLLTKMASENGSQSFTQEGNMNNTDLASRIMQKLAQEFSPEVTTPAAGYNVTPGTSPNLVQQANAEMTAFDDAKVQGIVPGGDGTVNSLFQTIVQKAVAQGAGSDDLVNGEAPSDQVEKAAAVSALCNEGLDFDTAVDLVKQAEQEIFADEWEVEKQAAFSALVDSGIDFDSAVSLVKQAEYDLEKEAGNASATLSRHFGAAKFKAKKLYNAAKGRVIEDAGDAGRSLRGIAQGENFKMPEVGFDGYSRGKHFKDLASNRLAQGVAGAAAVGGVGAYAAKRHYEKKACMEQLMAEGVDFDSAVELTKQAEYEVYGQ